MNREVVAKVGTFFVLIGLCAAVRLIPHPPNFTPVASAAIFAGFYYRNRVIACLLPLLAVLVSDVILGSYSLTVMTAVYASHLLPVVLGILLARRLTAWRIFVCAFAAAVLFYLGTNLAVWCSGVLYERTAAGLLACYTAGLPFFQHTLMGNLFFCILIFGGYAVAQAVTDYLDQRRMIPHPVRKR